MKKPLTFTCRQKIKFILHIFLEILQRYCKLVFICRQKINFTPMHFGRYCKDMQAPYFGYFEDARLATPRMIISTCRKLWFLSASQKQTSSFTFFLRYYMLKNPAIWLTERILVHNSRTRILPGGKMPRKINDNFLKKILLWGHFGPFFPKLRQK